MFLGFIYLYFFVNQIVPTLIYCGKKTYSTFKYLEKWVIFYPKNSQVKRNFVHILETINDCLLYTSDAADE